MAKVKLDIYAGMLGAGKTTIILQMLKSTYIDKKVVIIENEVGKINIDSSEFSQQGITVRQLTSGCICCSIKGNLTIALNEIVAQLHPDYIILEPSGIANLHSLEMACSKCNKVEINRCVYIVKASSVTKLLTVVGQFYYEHLRWADMIYLNFADKLTDLEFKNVCHKLLEINPDVTLIDTPISKLNENTFPEKTKDSFLKDQFSQIDSLEFMPILATEKKIIPKSKHAIFTWDYKFSYNFTKEKIKKLCTIICNPTYCDIWRVKGFLRMDDNTVTKINIVFGDCYEEKVSVTEQNNINQLVFIGSKIPINWLKKQFENEIL